MSGDPLCVEPQVSVRHVFTLLKQQRSGGVLVCRNSALIGIFTERDALRRMASGAPLDLPVEQAMVANPVSLNTGDSVAKAIRTMSLGGYRRLPVINDQGRPVGVLNVADVVHYLVEHFPQAVYNLPPESKTVAQGREGA
jgi:CBS domain-containing protein